MPLSVEQVSQTALQRTKLSAAAAKAIRWLMHDPATSLLPLCVGRWGKLIGKAKKLLNGPDRVIVPAGAQR